MKVPFILFIAYAAYAQNADTTISKMDSTAAKVAPTIDSTHGLANTLLRSSSSSIEYKPEIAPQLSQSANASYTQAPTPISNSNIHTDLKSTHNQYQNPNKLQGFALGSGLWNAQGSSEHAALLAPMDGSPLGIGYGFQAFYENVMLSPIHIRMGGSFEYGNLTSPGDSGTLTYLSNSNRVYSDIHSSINWTAVKLDLSLLRRWNIQKWAISSGIGMSPMFTQKSNLKWYADGRPLQRPMAYTYYNGVELGIFSDFNLEINSFLEACYWSEKNKAWSMQVHYGRTAFKLLKDQGLIGSSYMQNLSLYLGYQIGLN